MADLSNGGKGATAQSRKAHNLEVALTFARNGIPVMPLIEKEPTICMYGELDRNISSERRQARRDRFVAKYGFEPLGIGSTTDEAIILGWWEATTGELATGISPGLCGAIVLDTDNKTGDNADAALMRAYLDAHGLTLDSDRDPINASGRREGRHLWFRNPEGLGNGIAQGLKADWKGAGGLVVAPGSMLPPAPDGDGTARRYAPVAGSRNLIEAIRAGTLPELPACLRALHSGVTGGQPKPEFPELQAAVEAGPEVDIRRRRLRWCC